MVRFSLRDVMCMQTLAALSAGAVFAAELLADEILCCFDPPLIERIESATGWQRFNSRGLFLGTLQVLNGIVYASLLAFTMSFLLILRNRWTTLLAFSLPFGILCLAIFKPWIFASPADAKMALFYAKLSILPTLIAVCLLLLGVYFKKRLQAGRYGMTIALVLRPHWRVYLISATTALHLITCVYGWYCMFCYRKSMIESMRYWDL